MIYWKKPPKPIVIYQRGPRIDDATMVRALAAEMPLPVFESVLQLLDDHEQVCMKTAIGLVGDHGALASEVGGVQVIGELRVTLLDLRARGRAGEDEE